MFRPTPDNLLIALFFEGFLYGLYSGIFGMYLQCQASKQDTNKTQNTIFYSMCALYVSSGSVFVFDIAYFICQFQIEPAVSIVTIFRILYTLFAWCDFIAQFILIYRCWIVWGCNIRIVIIPSTLAFAFPIIWIVGNGSTLEGFAHFGWQYWMALTGLALSLTVNALTTGLIMFRIFKVFREVKATSHDNVLGATDGRKLRRIMLVLIESAMALFSIQLARFVVNILRTAAAMRVYNIIVGTHQMLNGIAPTIILVRTSMGLSFHDEKSMEEAAIGSLRFASNGPGSVLGIGSIGIVDQDIGGDDHIDIQRSKDVGVVER